MTDKKPNGLGPTDLRGDDGIAHTMIEAAQIAAASVPVTVQDHEHSVHWNGEGEKEFD